MRWPWQPKGEAEPQEEAPFVADAPIRSANEDALGRTDFAKNLADLIAKWRGDTSLVIAVRSPWGNGKTSVKNLVLEQLRKTSPKLRVLQFNPWQYDSADAITVAFYRELRLALGKKSDGLNAWKRRHALRKYGRYFTAASSGLTAAGGQITPVLAAMTVLGLTTFGATYFTPANMVRWGSLMVAIVGLLGLFGKLLVYLGDPEEETPQQHVRTELETLLRRLKQPLLIVIDDLDRLDQDAIRLVIRHVKVNADLPNLTYLLLFQRDIVEAALDVITGGQGREYLDKVILAPFDLPPVERERIEKVLFTALDKLLAKLPQNTGFDQNRWGNAYHGGLKYYFRNLRDVHRFTASLAVQMTLHVGTKMVEVNIVDIFILETLRLFEPDVYTAIAQNRALMIGGRLEERDREKVRTLLKGARNETAAQELLTQLFPNLSSAFPGGMSYSDGFFSKWARARRVAIDRNFDRYFSLRLPDNTISESELEDFLEHAGDRASIEAAFDDFKRRGLLDSLMSRLDEIREELPVDHIETLAGALFDIGDDLQDTSFLVGSSPYIACWRAASWYFHNIKDTEERSRRFLATLELSSGLSVPATLIELDDGHREKDERNRLILTDEDLPKAKEIWITKLREALEEPATFLTRPRALTELYVGRRWGCEEDIRVWATRIINDPTLLMLFLKAFVTTSHSWGMSDHVATVNHTLAVKYLRDFVDLDELSTRLSLLDKSTLSPGDISLIDEFEQKRHAPLGDDNDDRE